MAELVFNISNVFNTDNGDGCLEQYNADHFHIPAYQRGYKWASHHETDPVKMLLEDLFEAYQLSKLQPDKEYYLQYITVKKPTDKNYLEVIDGQQRLTTLSILLAVMSLRVEGKLNLTVNRLDYAIRENFFVKHIYKSGALSSLLQSPWDRLKGISLLEDGVVGKVDYNNQDVFYITEAAKAMDSFLMASQRKSDLPNFYDFVTNSVFIIINAVEPDVLSERVFSNLNNNKVPLTEAELIKALLLTKLAREKDSKYQKKHFKEILEIRAFMGRIWDEIARWVNDPEKNSFYFNINDGMEGLLTLVAIMKGYNPEKKERSSHHPLFNFFHKLQDTREVFEMLKRYYYLLKQWYDDDERHNLLGFLFFAKGTNVNRMNLLKEIIDLDQSSCTKKLNGIKSEMIPVDINTFFYVQNNPNSEIHRALLALSVFNTDNKKITRFDFHAFNDPVKKWSLEHIFSQKPEGLQRPLLDEDKACVMGILGNDIPDNLLKIIQKKTRTELEKQFYYDALQKNGLINSIGNMALLTTGDNSSNSNNQFDDKRENILELVRSGSFVPRHTFEVFSKIILKKPGNLRNWDVVNINEHSAYILSNIDLLKTLKGL